MAAILIVDDSSVMRAVMRNVVAPLGAEVVEAANGVAGLKLASNRHFDLILVDLNMPLMDGLAMTRQVRLLPGCEGTPIFMVTSEATQKTLELGRAAGVTAWLWKPIDIHMLRQAVQQVLKACA